MRRVQLAAKSKIKHGYRLRLERDGDRVRLIARGGYDWTKRYPWIVESALKNCHRQFVIDGEAVVLGVDGVADFNALHSRKHDDEVQLYAFDILAFDGDDMRRLPMSMRETNLDRLLARRLDGIFIAPFEQGEIGPDLFRAACDMGLEGFVSKRPTGPIRPVGRSIGSRCYGAADGEGCGTLGALSNDTNGAPHVATF